jgi:putative addiction module killer protein
MKVTLLRTEEFNDWLNSEKEKSQAQVEKRLLNIQDHDHFGDSKDLGEGLAELKWKNGRRVYYALSIDAQGKTCILVLGGNKNGQDHDIKEARKIIAKLSTSSDQT